MQNYLTTNNKELARDFPSLCTYAVTTDACVTGEETTIYNFNFRLAPSSPIGLAGQIWGGRSGKNGSVR